MQDYTLSLALFDFLPVAFSAAGLVFLVFALRAHKTDLWRLALLGGLLVVCGGMLKATWKLLWVTTQVDHSWMSSGLFWCLGPGFVLLGGASLALLRPARTGHLQWLAPVTIAILGCLLALFWASGSKGIPLLMTVLGNLFMMGCLITFSSRMKLHHSTAMLVVSVLATFTLSGLARIPDQTAALQWAEEGINFVGQGLFALAVFILWRRIGAVDSRRAMY